MSTNTDGMAPQDRERQAAELIRRSAELAGADLDDLETLGGFLAAIGAVLTRAAHLSKPDRDVQAAALFSIIDTMSGDGDRFIAGWNASLQTQLVMMKGHTASGQLSPEGYTEIAKAAAALTRVQGAPDAG